MSRTSLLTRFRSTDRGTRRRVRARPSREAAVRAGRTCSTAKRPRSLRGPRSTAPNDPRAAKRWRREYPSLRAFRGIGVPVDSDDGDALAALGAARVDDGAAAGRLHAHAKAMRLL